MWHSAYNNRRVKQIFRSNRSRKYEKQFSNDGKPQINTTAPEVYYRPQEAKLGALEPPSPPEPKLKGGATLTRRKEGNKFSIRIGPERQRQKWSSQGLFPPCGR